MNIFSNLSRNNEIGTVIHEYDSTQVIKKKKKNISNEFIKTEYYWVIILMIIIVEKRIIIFHVTIVKQINI